MGGSLVWNLLPTDGVSHALLLEELRSIGTIRFSSIRPDQDITKQ